jgi:hypothetical protein
MKPQRRYDYVPTAQTIQSRSSKKASRLLFEDGNRTNLYPEDPGIKKRRFLALLKQYIDIPEHFSILYRRTRASGSICAVIEQTILKERVRLSPLKRRKKLKEGKRVSNAKDRGLSPNITNIWVDLSKTTTEI